jgi:hypothetical protein
MVQNIMAGLTLLNLFYLVEEFPRNRGNIEYLYTHEVSITSSVRTERERGQSPNIEAPLIALIALID